MALWGKLDTTNSKPKYLNKQPLRNNQTTTDKDATYGVNVTEAQVASNRAKGIKTPGWVKYTEYTDAQGHTRRKAETLVAFSSGETAAVTGDAADDAVVADA
jgi:hypothetical protein